MAKYKLTNEAKEDLIRIHGCGVKKLGMTRADKYFESFFECFDLIAQRSFSYESVSFIEDGYGHCVCGSDSIYYKIDNIYYKINEDVVEIMTTVGRQDLTHML